MVFVLLLVKWPIWVGGGPEHTADKLVDTCTETQSLRGKPGVSRAVAVTYNDQVVRGMVGERKEENSRGNSAVIAQGYVCYCGVG